MTRAGLAGALVFFTSLASGCESCACLPVDSSDAGASEAVCPPRELVHGSVSEWRERGCSSTSWQWLYPQPYGDHIYDAVVDDEGVLWAVGVAGTIARLHEDHTLEVAYLYPAVSLTGVWTDGNEIIVVGEGGVELRHRDGEWSFTQHGPDVGFTDVFGTSLDDLWLLQWHGAALHHDGIGYTEHVISTETQMTAGVSLAVDDAWVVLADGNSAHWDGSSWQAVSTGPIPGSALVNIAAGNDGTLIAVGFNRVLSWSGDEWRSLIPTADSEAEPRWDRHYWGLLVESASSIWLSGCSDDATLYFDGTTWERLDDAENSREACIEAFAPANGGGVWGGGQGGRISLLKPASTLDVFAGARSRTVDIALDGRGTLWIADGVRAPILNRIGADGTLEALPGRAESPDAPPFVRQILLDGNAKAWVTSSGLHHWDGERWTLVDVGAFSPIDDLSISGDTLWLIAGDDVARGSASGTADGAFALVMTPANTGLNSIYAAADDDVWIAGDDALLARWDGASFDIVPVDLDPEADIRHVRGRGGAVWLTAGKAVLQRSGSEWVTHALDSARSINDLVVRSDDDVWVATDDTVLHWNGETWRDLPPGMDYFLTSLAVGEHVYAGGWTGVAKGPRADGR